MSGSTKIWWQRVRRNFRGPAAIAGILVFFSPSLITVGLNLLFGIPAGVFLIVGGIAIGVGLIYFHRKEDEYLIVLLAGVQVIIASGVVYILK